MVSDSESILIVGSGALACLFAARFVTAGLPAIMLANWPEGTKALREKGVHLIDTDGSESRLPVQVINSSKDRPPFSHALVLVKSWQTERSARQLVDYMLPDGRVLTLQNGLGNHEILVRYLGDKSVFTGITTYGARLLGPGRVQANGVGAISLVDHPDLRSFVDWFERAGFTVRSISDMDGLIWGKLVVNAAINPLTALLGVPNGVLLKLDPARSLMADIAREVAAVAAAKGISLPFKDPAGEVEDVAGKTAMNYSSMLQDIQRGAPTEIDAICGAIIKNGDELGVPTPINTTLYNLVKASVDKIRST